MFKCLVVNQDGSTYHIYHHYPHKIITLPLDPLTLTEEEKEVCETANTMYTTVKPLFNDPLRKGQLLYKGHFPYLQLYFCMELIHFQLSKRGQPLYKCQNSYPIVSLSQRFYCIIHMYIIIIVYLFVCCYLFKGKREEKEKIKGISLCVWRRSPGWWWMGSFTIREFIKIMRTTIM